MLQIAMKPRGERSVLPPEHALLDGAAQRPWGHQHWVCTSLGRPAPLPHPSYQVRVRRAVRLARRAVVLRLWPDRGTQLGLSVWREHHRAAVLSGAWRGTGYPLSVDR